VDIESDITSITEDAESFYYELFAKVFKYLKNPIKA